MRTLWYMIVVWYFSLGIIGHIYIISSMNDCPIFTNSHTLSSSNTLFSFYFNFLLRRGQDTCYNEKAEVAAMNHTLNTEQANDSPRQ